jgi:ribosome-associated protein
LSHLKLLKGRTLSPSPERVPNRSPKGASSAASSNRSRTGLGADAAARIILSSLDEDKAEEVVSIDIKGKSSVADRLIVASGRSQRHVAALAEHLMQKLKDSGAEYVRAEGLPHADWVLIDAGDVIIHLFRPEVRHFYNIEKIWSPASPAPPSAA